MIDRNALRAQLIESYKPKESSTPCALCEQTSGPMSLHLLEVTIPETNPMPPRFVPMARSRGMIRGSFPVCTDCAPVCSKCGLPVQSKKVQEGYHAIKVSAPSGAGIYAGNGYCRHLNLFKKLGQRGLPQDFMSPFDRIGSEEDINREETEADGYRAVAQRHARVRQLNQQSRSRSD